MFQVSLQVDLGNLFIKSIQNTQVTPLNDLLTILSTISPILILGQIVFSMWFFINLMRNFHTNQEFLTFNVKQDEFKNFIAFISLAYVIIYHTPI